MKVGAMFLPMMAADVCLSFFKYSIRLVHLNVLTMILIWLFQPTKSREDTLAVVKSSVSNILYAVENPRCGNKRNILLNRESFDAGVIGKVN